MLRKNIIKNTCTFHLKLLACMVHKLSFSLHFLTISDFIHVFVSHLYYSPIEGVGRGLLALNPESNKQFLFIARNIYC